MSESNEDFRQARCKREEDILHTGAGGGETRGGIADYTIQLGYESEDRFIKELEGKKILDLGSGLGILAKDIHLRGIACQVFSVNPRLSLSKARQGEKVATSDWLQRVRGKKRKGEKVQKYHDERATAAFAHALPFENDLLDLILDNQAVSKYAADVHDEREPTKEEKDLFKQSIQEMIRVLKPGGEIRIGDLFGYGSRDSWKEQILKELGLEYEVIWEDLSGDQIPGLWKIIWGNRRALGVEIRRK